LARPPHAVTKLLLAMAGCTSACHAVGGARVPAIAPQTLPTLAGQVRFDRSRTVQAALTDVANAASVALIDGVAGNTVSSTVSDASGSFQLTFSNFTPTLGYPYVLEAVKGLPVGGAPNRVGAAAARLRTLVFWNGSWQSLSSGSIVVGYGTTAVSVIANLKALTAASMSALINSVNPGDTFTQPGSWLSNATDYQPVLTFVNNAIQLDQDPIASIAYSSALATYSLSTGVPVVNSFAPSIPTPGGTLTLRGAYLDRLIGRNTFVIGGWPASTWSVSLDRTSATVTVPGSAYSGPFNLVQPGGVAQLVSPFLYLHGTVGTYAGSGAQGDQDGLGQSAVFSRPEGIVRDSAGNLYVAEAGGNCIRKISPSGQVTTLAGSTTAGFQNGVGANARFNNPTGLAIDPSTNNLYVCDWNNGAVRMITSTGVVTTVAGTGTSGYNDGATSSAQFSRPLGVAFDPATQRLYVGDSSNNCIRLISAGVVSTLAGNTAAGSVDGVGTAARFNVPSGVVLDGFGNLYIADYGAARIRCLNLATNYVSTVTGVAGAGWLDGASGSARLNGPEYLGADSLGNIYVAGDNSVRKIASPSQYVSTLAGQTGANFADGSTSSALFNNTQQLVVDPSGNVYVTDWNGNRIRVITP